MVRILNCFLFSSHKNNFKKWISYQRIFKKVLPYEIACKIFLNLSNHHKTLATDVTAVSFALNFDGFISLFNDRTLACIWLGLFVCCGLAKSNIAIINWLFDRRTFIV